MTQLEIIMIVIWSMIFLATLVIELIGQDLVTIWFTLGSLVSLILAIVKVIYWIQIIVFAIVSLLCLSIIFPLYKKYYKKNGNQKDINEKIGIQTVLLEDITEDKMGFVKINGVLWEVISNNKIKKGTKVVVIGVEGNKLLIKEDIK